MLYDCNEGTIASNNKGSPKIFSTLTKFEETSSIYQASSIKSSRDSKDVKMSQRKIKRKKNLSLSVFH
jgi:hypothetical protein